MQTLTALALAAANAPVAAKNPRVRGTVPGQLGTGAVMTLIAKAPVRRVGAASAVAGVVEIHEMAIESKVMLMRAIERPELAACKPVELKPGGHHVLLMDLNRPLKPGEKIAVELRFETGDGRKFTLPLEAEVRMNPPAAAMPMKR